MICKVNQDVNQEVGGNRRNAFSLPVLFCHREWLTAKLTNANTV